MIDMNGCEREFNTLARERMKQKLLADILVDMEICKIEGWDITEYLIDIGNMIQSHVDKVNRKGA